MIGRSLGILMLAAAPTAAAAATISVERAEIERCFEEPDRLDRLACYDDVLANPNVMSTGVPVAQAVAPAVLAPSVRNARVKRDSALRTQSDVAVTVLNRATGTQNDIPGAAEASLFRRLYTATVSPAFRAENDIHLAIASIDQTGEPGILLVSCENNITHLRVQWDQPFSDTTVDTQVYFGSMIGDRSATIDQHMRVQGDGHLLVAPRGLESIRILTRIVSGERVNFSTNSDNQLRSMFFDMNALRGSLDLIARNCSWAQQNFGWNP